MPSDIRNATYAKTAVDLLLPPASAPGRTSDGGAGFDSLLRALAPPQPLADRPPAQDRPSPSASDERREVNDYTSTTSRSEDNRSSDRRDDVNRSQETNQSQRNEDAARADAAAPVNPSDNASAQDVKQGTSQTEASGEASAEDQATAAAQDEAATEDAAAEQVDADAMQLVAMAGQPAPVVDQPAAENPESAEGAAELNPDAEAEGAKGAAATAEATAPKSAIELNPTDLKQPTAAENGDTAEVPVAPDVTAESPVEVVTELQDASTVVSEAEATAEDEKEVEISNLRSTRTKTSDSIFHDVDPKQLKEAGNENEAVDGTQKPESESAEAEVAAGAESILPDVQAVDDSRPRSEKRERNESTPSEIKTPSVESAAEAPAVETGRSEPPPAESAPNQASDASRTDQRSASQAPPTLLDGNTRPAGAPRLAAEVLAGPRETSHARPVEVDSARFLSRVARAFTVAQQRGGEVQLRLSPPELGSLRVEVKVVEGVMTAKVETENAAAKAAVMEHLPQLRERLAEQGVRIERFDVDLMQQGSTGTPDRPADRQPDEAFAGRGSGGPTRRASQAAAETKAVPASPVPTGGLNVIV